jgi:small subunit ribosomal protein S1
VGDEVEAVVLDVDEFNRKISLGMKQIEPNPWQMIEDKYPVGTRVSGQVRNITSRSSTPARSSRRATRSRPWC